MTPKGARALRAIFLAGLLTTTAVAGPYSWELSAPREMLAPTDRSETKVVGACLQGALIDIRYGQVSIARSGTAEVLDLDKASVITLNARVISEEELLKHLPEGLSVYARYDHHSGKVGWLDCVSNSAKQEAVQIQLNPYKGPAYRSGESLNFSVSRTEIDRLGLKNAYFFIPGLTHSLATTRTAKSLGGTLKVYPGLDYTDLRVFLTDGQRSFRGRVFNISTSPPSIDSFGPDIGSARLPSIWGWVDHHSEAQLLNLKSSRIQSSPGSRITEFQTTPWRSSFKLEADGPGTYWIDFEISDQLGRRATKRWPINIRP